MNGKAEKIIKEMTLEEKAAYTSGVGSWNTESFERFEVTSVRVSDGPHGLRKEKSYKETIPAICFPAGCATAASFDEKVLQKVGQSIAKHCQAEQVDVILGPGVNIKRSPLCGRNFEYFSEDPLLAKKLGTAYVNGVQGEGVGTSLKHFFANSQETRRMTGSSNMDERTMREIYLSAFEGIVKDAKPWTVMASYNKIDGVHATQNEKYLTDVLRKEWGYEGLVVSDWGAVHDRVEAVKAGCDLTMPTEKKTDCKVFDAVKNGTLELSKLNESVQRLLELEEKAKANRKEGATYDLEEGHALAKEAETESAVLLKNDGILPLSKKAKVAFIGKFAKSARYQGGGSSHINAYKITSALEVAREKYDVTYAEGFNVKKDKVDDEMLSEAVAAAKNADVAVLFVGLPDYLESEGYDRWTMDLPNNVNTLVEEVAKANKNTVVVLHNGSPVSMPWIDKVKGVLEMYLGGENVGEATVDLLFGDAVPSGRLPETFPKRIEDNSSYLSYIGEGDNVWYQEGVFVGYRYYETKKADVLFPFGYGLSYADFEYSNLTVDKNEIKAGDEVTVSVDVKNVGKVAAKEVVQLYIAPKKIEIIRPVRELKGFTKIELKVGEKKTVVFTLNKRDFSYWDTTAHSFRMAGGIYDIEIRKNARDNLLSKEIKAQDEVLYTRHDYSMQSVVADVAKTEKGKEMVDKLVPRFNEAIKRLGLFDDKKDEADMEEMEKRKDTVGLYAQPFSIFPRFVPEITEEEWQAFFDELNA